MSQQDIQFKAIPGQFNIDEAQGVVECFVAGIGNKDSVGDVLITGAFTKSLTRRKPRVVWGHNWNDPIGKVLEIYEVAPGDRRLPAKMLNAGIGGLYARVQFNLNSEKGREAFANVAFFGQEQEWSIGYKTLDSIFDPNIQANILKEVELYEVSPVLHGANQLTGTISVKSDETAEKHMPGMMMPHHEGMSQGPKIIVVRQGDEDDDDDKPIFSEGLAQALGDNEKERLTRELQARSGSSIQLVSATDSTAKFRRMTSDGRSVMYRIGYHTPDNYVTFMFGKPELAEGQQTGGSRTVVPSQMPSMPMQVKPGVPTGATNFVVSPEYVMPKGEDYEKSAFDQELENLAQILDETFDVKVGRTLSSRNMSKLKTVLETLQDIVSSAEKDVESKSNYIIPVQIENAFETKQLLDPIFDYHRVESHVTEDGIVITTGVTQEFIEAIGVAEKALGRTLSGGLGKLGRAGRGAVNFDPKAWDGDGDGIVQEGTPYSRPAIPGVNDRASGGRVDTNAATRAWQNQRRSGMASRMGSDDNADEYDEAMGPPMRRPSRGMADDPVGDAASENLDRDRNAGAVRRGLSSSTSGSRGKPEPLKREGKFHNGNIYDEFNGQYVEGEVIALSDIYGDDTPGYGIVGRYDMDGQGTAEYFYGGDDEEFKTIEDAMAFLENIEEEGENDRFYDEPEFRSVDRKRSAGKPGERPLAGLSSSTADIVSKDDLPKELVNDVANAAVRAVGRSGDETRLIDGAKEVLANLTNEKLKDSVGKSVSNARKRLAEMLSDEKVIEEFQSQRAIEDFMDQVGYAIDKMLDLHVDSVKKTGTSLEKEEIEEIVDNAKSKFNDDFNKLIEASKDFWDKRSNPGKRFKANSVEDAKKLAAKDRKSLMQSLRDGGGDAEDLEATLQSIMPDGLWKDMSEGIISGKISPQDFNYVIERAVEEINYNDPSINPEELVNELADALREGASKDGANPLIVALAKEFGDEKITGGDLIDYLNGSRQDSVYRPDRGKIERENIRGFASRTGSGDGGKRPRLNEYELAAIEKMVKDTGLPRKLFDDLAVTERIGNPEDAFYQAQEYGLSKEKIRGLQSQYAKALKEAKGKRKGGFASRTGGGKRLSGDDFDENNALTAKGRKKVFDYLVDNGTDKDEANSILDRWEQNDGTAEEYMQEYDKDNRDVIENIANAASSMYEDDMSSGGERQAERRKGFSSETGGTPKREMDMTLAEYAELDKVLKKYMDESQLDGIGADEDMQVIQDILDKLDESSAANDSIPLTDKEIDDYMDTLTRMRDNGPVEDSGDKESIDKLIDSLKKTKDSKDGTYESDALQQAGTRLSRPSRDGQGGGRGRTAKRPRGFKSSNGTINPHKKLDIELNDSEIGELRDELQGFMKMTDNPAPLRAIAEKLEKATNGKFSVEKEEYEEVIKEIDKMRDGKRVVTSDVVTVLEQAAESQKGKYSSSDLNGGGGFSSSTGGRKNNGAPSDIPETMQRQLIMWGRQQGGLRLVQEAIQRFDKDKGTMPASYWKRLRTMYENMGPGSASGAARRTGRRGIFGRGKDTDTSPRGSAGFIIDDRPVPKGLLDNTMSNNPIVTDGFIDTRSGSMGGSQGGGVFKDPKTGKEYYIKPPKSQTHAENESLMSRFYERLGIPAGKVKVGTYQGKPKIVSEMVPGAVQVRHETEIKNPAWKKAVQDTFVANAWLANWDAVSNSGNTIKGGDGKAYVIDVGGAGLFRARGGAKDSAFGPIVGEMESLRDPNQSGAERGVAYWGDIPPAEIARQVKEIGAISDSEIKQMVDAVISDKAEAKKLSDTLIARRDYLVTNWSTGKNSGTGRRGRTGFSSSSEGYEGRNKRPGAMPGMRPEDFEVRPRDGEPTGVGKGGAMGTKPDPKFTGDSFDKAKPEEWDDLTIDEKWGWMLGEGNPEKGGTMSPAAYEGAMKKLGEEEAREELKQMTPEERRKSRSASRASALSELSDNEKARLATEKEDRQKRAQESSKRVKEEATAEQAKAKRQARLDAFNEWIDDSIRELSGMDYDETDINPDSEDIWDTVSTILGVEDITPKSLKEAIDELSSYVDITSGENAYEKKSVARANALLKKLLKMQSEYSEDKWFNGTEGGRSGFQSSTGGKPRPPRGIRPRPGTPEMPQSNAKREGDIKRLSTLIEQVVAELDAKRQNPSPKKGRMGFSSSTGKTMITDEATFFKDVENSLAKEIRAAQKARNTKAASGLTKLQEIIKRSEASKTGDRRTNAGSIYMTMDEVDLILDGLQFALDQQVQAGGDKRIAWYSKLIEKIAAAAMSTFIDKSTTEIGSTRRTVTNKNGVKKKINIVPEP
jgi:HK97 family phage prohead protease